MFRKLLIANRGDSACRIAATCRRLGVPMAGVHSAADRGALHVRRIGESVEIGAGPPSQSYLNGEAILAAARRVGADAVHPGIGFLSENAEFARAVEDAGLVFVGPAPATLAALADKVSAKAAARAAGLAVLDGSEASAEAARVEQLALAAGLPVVLKAVAGGGGRGMRVVRLRDQLAAEIESAMREAQGSFGRPDLMVERFLERARHIEVQIAGDGKGAVVHLHERDCSLQRRHQKVIEEAPAPGLEGRLRETMAEAACKLAARLAYRGLGTIEFLVADDAWFFLEANPRLQVEHPVTEAITGLDLVELQLRIAAGRGLGLAQKDVRCSGHAIEARVYSEEPALGFAPSTGRILELRFPREHLRVDESIAAGDEVQPHYDPMLAKLIAHGAGRDAALATLAAALAQSTVLGVETNLHFLERLLAREEVREGRADAGFIDRELETLAPARDSAPAAAFAAAAAIALEQGRAAAPADPWRSQASTGWRLGRGVLEPARKPAMTVIIGRQTREAAFSALDASGAICVRIGEETMRVRCEDLGSGHYRVACDGAALVLAAAVAGERVFLDGAAGSYAATIAPWLMEPGPGDEVAEGRVLAPVMGRVAKVCVQPGERVRAGDVMLIQDSMKMEFRVCAPRDGVVASLACAQGDMVERGALLAEVGPEAQDERRTA